MFYAVAIAIPFVAALQRYAVAYGYAGVSRSEAWHSARGVFIGTAFVAGVIALFHHGL